MHLEHESCKRTDTVLSSGSSKCKSSGKIKAKFQAESNWFNFNNNNNLFGFIECNANFSKYENIY